MVSFSHLALAALVVQTVGHDLPGGTKHHHHHGHHGKHEHKLPVVGENDQAPGGGAGSGKYEYVSHAGKPVVKSAVVKFTSDDLNTGTEPGSAVEHYARSLGESHDDAGHIYANQLGGLAEPINIFPQSPHINRGSYRKLETKIYKCMKTGGASSATLSWEFTYASDSDTRPNGVTYSAKFDAGCDDLKQTFDNPDDNAHQKSIMV